MNEQLQNYLDSVKFKDSQGIAYYFDIYGVKKGENNNLMNIPIITVKQSRKKATGAANFEKAVTFAEKSSTYDAVRIVEYDGYTEDANVVNDMTIVIERKSETLAPVHKSGGKKTKQDLEAENAELKAQLGRMQQQNNDSGLLGRFNTELGYLGFNGLGDVISSSASLQSSQDRLEDLRAQLQDVKTEKSRLEIKLEECKRDIEQMKDQKRKAEDDLRECKMRHDMEVESLNQKNSALNVLTTGFLGFLDAKTGFSSKIGELAGVPNAEQQDTLLDGMDEESASMMKDIITYMKTLDKMNFQMLAKIIQYCSGNVANINALVNLINKYNQPQNTQNNGNSANQDNNN